MSSRGSEGTTGDAIRLIAGGSLLVIGLLWTLATELGAVRDHRKRYRMVDQVNVINSDRLLDLENGQLVAMSGHTRSLTELSDPEFHARTKALHMRRVVEIFQWVEVKEEGERRYRTEWTRSPVDSSDFPPAHYNPKPKPPVPGPWTETAQKVYLGSFEVSSPLIRGIQQYKPWVPDHMTPPPGWHSRGTSYIRAEDPENPDSGDLRVRFEIVPPGPVTILAAQEDNVLVPWQDPWRGPVYRVEVGNLNPASLLPTPEPAPLFKLWSLRLLSFLLQAVGFFWLISPLVDHLPPVLRFRPPSGPTPSLLYSLILSLLLAALTWVIRVPAFSIAILLLFLLAGVGCVLQVRGLSPQKN